MIELPYDFFYLNKETELVGIYIDTCGIISDQYIPFSYNFTYAQTENSIQISKNTNQIPEYFGKGIIGVTALVGKNGNKKTTTLEALISILSNTKSKNDKFIVIQWSRVDLRYKEIQYSISKDKYEPKRKIQYDSDKIDSSIVWNRDPDTQKAPIALISSQFDGRNAYDYKNIAINYFNYSTNYLLVTEPSHIDPNINPSDNEAVFIFKRKQTERYIDALINFHDNIGVYSDFNFPPAMYVTFEKINMQGIEDMLSPESTDQFRKIRQKLSKAFNGEKYNLEIRNNLGTSKYGQAVLRKVKFWFKVNFFDMYFYLLSMNEDIDKYLLTEYLSDEEIDKLKAEDLISRFFVKQNWIKPEEFDLSEYVNEISSLIDVSEAPKLIENNEATFTIPLNNAKEFNLLRDKFNAFKDKYYRKEAELDYKFEFISIKWQDVKSGKWHELSSGELSYLDLFSRIFNAVNNIKKELTVRSIIIFIDEPDLYLHPEWQRLIMHKIFKFLEALHLQTGIQFYLVFTTHSPFLISDLPKETVVALGRIPDIDLSTLGANMYDILKSPFFLDSGYIGEHIKAKIEDFLKAVDKKQINSTNRTQYESLVNALGDGLLKTKLNHILSHLEAYDKN